MEVKMEEIRQLTLRDKEHKDTTLHRLQKGWKLHFVLGPSLQSKQVHVFTNHPPGHTPVQRPFNRGEFYELEWKTESSSRLDKSDQYCEVRLHLAGAFQYYFTHGTSNAPQGSGYFVVDPTLKLTSDTDILELDCITLQTVLTKCLGPLSEWEQRLATARETGYNFLHFTPIQELGASNSSYSIRDQHKLNPLFTSKGQQPVSNDDISALVVKLQYDWGMLSLCDVVWNHTSFDSPWLIEHPECAYNVHNSPHLRPAYVLDRVLWHFTLEVIDGKWTKHGVPSIIKSEEHIENIRSVLVDKVLPKYKLEEYYQLDVAATLDKFKTAAKAAKTVSSAEDSKEDDVKLIKDPKFRRLGGSVNMEKALQCFNIQRKDAEDEEDRLQKSCDAFKKHLLYWNNRAANEMSEDIRHALHNVCANVRYHRVDEHGPRCEKVTKNDPLVPKYFIHLGPNTDPTTEEKVMDSDKAPFLQIGNGWVMDADPLKNFAEPGSKVYLRRELIVWGDSVKLRYGETPEDCPYLWNHMLEYSRTMARMFHGLRIDNCHSTPVHVAEYFLDEARRVRPDLLVVAELFTQSEHVDNMFINRLGINTLIREAMNAYNAHDLGRLVHRFGGEAVGSFLQPRVRPLTPSMSHALLMDVTHDNQSPVMTRSVYDLLPTAALVCMACCAVGSSRGYDELVPEHIHVVKENRLYTSWKEDADVCHLEEVSHNHGIIKAKRVLNELHQTLGAKGYTQVYVDQVDENIVAVTRHNPVSHQSVILMARTAFKHPSNPSYTGYIPPLCVPGVVEEIILEARMVQKAEAPPPKSDTHINGLGHFTVDLQSNIQLYSSQMVELADHGSEKQSSVQEIDFINFPPGSVIAFKVTLNPASRKALSALRACISQFGYRVRTLSGNPPNQNQVTSNFHTIARKLSLADLNRVLYRCDVEERDDGKGSGGYHIPQHGSLVYCGLQGFMSALDKIRSKNDLGHSLCENLRQGDWMAQYVGNRLKLHASTRQLGQWFEAAFSNFSLIPRYLIPCYFDAILVGAYVTLLDLCWQSMSKFVFEGSSFTRALALGSVQMCGIVKTCPLPELSPKLSDVPTVTDEETNRREQCAVTMAAGLPHFSGGFMRSWGRDTFIAVPGLLIVTGRMDDAKYLILAYAATLRHGVIPNLLGGGSHARYNCRDAVWWWLYCIQLYCQGMEDGYSILECPVSRIFPGDEDEPQPAGFVDQPLSDVIQEAMQRHVEGISYRERHAGKGLDQNMSHEGFNVTIGVDHETGFPFGGSKWNCGTWMDKVGESDIAGNRGTPATPRDGSAVEIVGLCKATVRWLAKMHEAGHYPHSGVTVRLDGKLTQMSYKEWDAKLQANFEKNFWIAPDANKETNELINRRGIYKDSVGATQFWADYQLRPNYPIAMVVAPELFTPSRAWTALEMAEEFLLGPLGMKTLDPSDWGYVGDYDNSYDGHETKRARGFNYHQGPEWVWPIGYFLRAKLHFARRLTPDPSPSGAEPQDNLFQSTVNFVRQTLTRHHTEVELSLWKGLPELTNSDGQFCKDGCPTQAWSMGCILEVLNDCDKLLEDTAK
ncbi:glycogen debranching enzyme-like [Patiria miniata]|uniref:Glycogen debranching enzyme n=1 Tax=Patiria miniata TaxID=46514 RepID=A0A913ZC40_PATMI|nr:glycogen debranching enzyme-like [Patiria miniata]